MKSTKAILPAVISVLFVSLSVTTFAQSPATPGAEAAQPAPAANSAQPAPATQQEQPAQPAPATQPAQETPALQQAAPAPQQTQQAEVAGVPLRVMVGKSILINTADRLKRVSITDPAIADAVVVTPNQLMIHGRAPGEVTLVVWDEQERSRSFDLRVDLDVTAVDQEIKALMPNDKINVTASKNAIVLSGAVVDKDTAERAGAIASGYSKNVINVLTFGPVGAQEILLEVHFAEVDRARILQLGANIFSTGATNTFGTSSTGQFGPFNPINVTGTIGGSLTGSTFTLNSVDPLNLFLFRPDLNLGAVLKLLQEKNIVQILAEPNLIAVNGKEASFLAGGEFPGPIPQSATGATVITIQWKEFGVKLNFTPSIMPNGNVHLLVKPEVSSLDFTNGIVLSGFKIPSFLTRRAATELELQDGQSFMIAGLLDNRLTNNLSRMPGIGNVPIIGYLFRSKDYSNSRQELMVMVTVHRVSPSNGPLPLPNMPKPFLDKGKFDEKTKGN